MQHIEQSVAATLQVAADLTLWGGLLHCTRIAGRRGPSGWLWRCIASLHAVHDCIPGKDAQARMQASKAAPAIIFLDELDALAPVRSTREGGADQVSTARAGRSPEHK